MKTFILKWDPAISSCDMKRMKAEIAWMGCSYEFINFNWSIYEWEKAQKGDRIFMLKVGKGKTGEDYEHYVQRCSSNPFAKAVKIADLKRNLDLTRLNELTDADIERMRRYLKAYRYLTQEE